MSNTSGLLQFALVGSGEFLPIMEEIDRQMLVGRRQRAVFLPTASAPDGPDRFAYWLDLGEAHFARIGVEVESIPVETREDADDEELADRIAGAGLVYMSGGNPGYLAATLRDTLVWRAIEEAVENGAALAGCSAGAMAMGAVAPDVSTIDRHMSPGLSVLPHIAVIPHFDKIRGWVPTIVDRYLEHRTDGITVIGIDEDTALVGGPHEWKVQGRGKVHVLIDDEYRTEYSSGDTVILE